MDNLMLELAEPLVRMKEEKDRKVPANAKETELHFVRCIKPRPKPEMNDERQKLFVHTMTLQ